MDIQWHGRSCVSIKGKSGTVIVDPYDQKKAGFKLPKSLKPEVVLSNEDDPELDAAQFGKETHIFDWPGEYEACGILIQAIQAYDRPLEKDEAGNKQSTKANSIMIYSLMVDGLRVCHLGNIGHKLTPEMLEQIGEVDVLLVPIGGILGPEKAHEVIEQIEPRISIPIYFEDPTAFLKEVGAQNLEAQKVAKFQSRSTLPSDKMEVNLLEQVNG
ncbi:hypothetical protein COV82_00675 [Candidatus Peregrinibacteria bacterium CG11_big_fil_rev_8_21_14_0_20_46_8]|nr:MAG: hypothetical protein COV82_00675 [Candidatus Peregrinibacteria bacterium CG11_big_fil_rev_8_21_14_0_20_46_8]